MGRVTADHALIIYGFEMNSGQIRDGSGVKIGRSSSWEKPSLPLMNDKFVHDFNDKTISVLQHPLQKANHFVIR
jgi:hypothetical protein